MGVSIANILKAIADDKSLILFNTIAIAGGDSDILITRLGVTRKQFYSRVSALQKTGLISRKNRQYVLTSLGMIVYDSQLMIGKATNAYWKLKAIDSLETEHKLPADERNKIINTLVDNQDIIKILVKQS
ncbi:MAG TPA: hypothetical protein VEL70_02970 [Candidatus Acidoferrum sp.]|nr:hypothetical protein [Candidatus Acidoferrum sp.]